MDTAELYFRHRSTVLLLLVTPIVIGSLAARPFDWITVGIGAALAVAGAVLRLLSMRCIGRGARVHRADVRGALVTWGPYGWSRNPLYLAAALILTGLSLVSGWGAWGLLVFPGAILLYTPVILHEEGAIKLAVGQEFDDYRAKVSRWLGLPGGDAGPADRVPWGEVLRREKWLIPGVLAAALGIYLIRVDLVPLRTLLSKLGGLGGLGLQPEWVGLIALALGAIGNSWVVQRKKARRLRREAARAAGEWAEAAPAEAAQAAPEGAA